MVNGQWKLAINYRLWTIDFKRLLFSILLLFSITSYSKTENTAYNPIFRDSVLKNKIDSANWNAAVQRLNMHRPAGNIPVVQHQKQPAKSKAFLYISTAILLLLLLLRLLFDDFSFSLLEGMISVKKFFIFYKSKKYDSFLAVIFIYILKIVLLSLVTYILLQHFMRNDFTRFNYHFFFNIWLLLGVFFTGKNIVEYIFNSVIRTQETFKAFFLQNLFAEFVLSVIILFLMLIYIYNDHLSYNFMAFLFVFSFAAYLVFNIIRSYQLMSNVRIPYKLHFFLYICAFKIIPMLLLAKYILSNVVE